MTVSSKWVMSWLGLFAGGMATGLLATYVSPYFALAFFGNLFAWSLYLRRIQCPDCGAPIYQTVDDFYERPRIMRVPVEILKTKCHVCGCDLTKS